QNIRCPKASGRSDFRLGYATPHDVHAPFDLSVSRGTVLVPAPKRHCIAAGAVTTRRAYGDIETLLNSGNAERMAEPLAG
ncbi:hypothetical protein, partial [Aliihoeflea sp. 40Bstr573]|uniref:hypothetical protein n=1 Tax=Aliihoeflea sp. 40Bstr573 TaxID=2696467 RepID=UPI002095EFD2